jgi:hypothetical protein
MDGMMGGSISSSIGVGDGEGVGLAWLANIGKEQARLNVINVARVVKRLAFISVLILGCYFNIGILIPCFFAASIAIS